MDWINMDFGAPMLLGSVLLLQGVLVIGMPIVHL